MDLFNTDLASNAPPPLSILQPSQKDNLMQQHTPVQKKPTGVSFITPLRTATGRLKTTNCRDGFVYLNSKVDKMNEGIKAKLDENFNTEQDKLNWRDRVEIVTKQDHEDYTESAALFVNEMISNAVSIAESKSVLMKKPNSNQNKFEQSHAVIGGGEMFSDADFVDGNLFAQSVSSTDWDILASKGSSNSEQTDLSRQSLFAKFDPLYAKRQVPQQEMPRKSDIIDLVSYVPADTKDKRSRVTKSSVDFFFESPPALAAIEEEAFQFNQEEQKPTKQQEKTQTEPAQLAPIVDVLNYSARDIHRLILQHREKLLKKEEECKKEKEQLICDKSLWECQSDLHESNTRQVIETKEKHSQDQKEVLNTYRNDLKDIIQTNDKIKNTFYSALEKSFYEMKAVQSKENNNLKQLQEAIQKANVDNHTNFSMKQYEDALQKIKTEIENVSSKSQEVISKAKGAVIRADLKKNELEAKLQKTALECEELGKICEELM